MWTLHTDWYELVIRASSVFFFLFLIFRVWGKKHFGELTPFDFILILIMSEAVQNALVGDDKGIPASWIVITTLVLWNAVLNKISFFSSKAEKVIEGIPKVIIKNGKVNELLLKKETISEAELEEAVRMQGVLQIKDVEQATLEANGKISVIKKKDLNFLDRLFH